MALSVTRYPAYVVQYVRRHVIWMPRPRGLLRNRDGFSVIFFFEENSKNRFHYAWYNSMYEKSFRLRLFFDLVITPRPIRIGTIHQFSTGLFPSRSIPLDYRLYYYY